MVAIRPARASEADGLTALCVRSKAHWGYDAEFMRLSAATLRVTAMDIAQRRVIVATDEADCPVGVASVIPEGDTADLDLFFVDPRVIGQGVGRELFQKAVGLAQVFGARRMTILADPNAARFYERMGARLLRQMPSDAIPGRMLPFYELAVAKEPA